MSVTGLIDDTEEREPRRELADGDSLLERMADEVHQIWCGWMEYMFKKGVRGPESLSRWRMDELSRRRWVRQMKTPYAQLSEDEKKSDRELARRYLNIALQKEKDND